MKYAWRIIMMAGFGALAVVVIVGLVGHGYCGSYLVPLSASQSGLADDDPLYSCIAVNNAGIPFWSWMFAAIILWVTAGILRKAQSVISSTRTAGTPRSTPVAPPRASGRSDPMTLADEIERIAELHNSGVLTDIEFASAKAQVLNHRK
jgi:hypothetical protein